MSAAVVVTAGTAKLPGAIRSEWTKLWSVRSTWWYVAGTLALTALISLQLGFSADYQNTHLEPGAEPSRVMAGDLAVSSILMVQVVVAAMAMLTITSEYSTGSIRSTVQWTPVRRYVLLAKAAVIAPVTFALGLVVGAVGVVVGRLASGRWGYLDGPAVAVDLLAIAAYLALVSLFTIGAGAVIRSAVGTLTTVFLLLLVAPMMVGQSGFRIGEWIAALLPGGAGNNFLTGATDPLDPAVSLLLVAGWAVAGMAAGIRMMTARDA